MLEYCETQQLDLSTASQRANVLEGVQRDIAGISQTLFSIAGYSQVGSIEPEQVSFCASALTLAADALADVIASLER
jgi:hypothetical protein